MAGSKKFAPSLKKLKKAREQCDVAKSKMLTSGICISICVYCLFYRPYGLKSLLTFSTQCFEGGQDFHTNNVLVSAQEVWPVLLGITLPFLGLSAIGALLAEIGQIGITISWKPLSFRWSRLSLIAGLKRLSGVRSAEEGEGISIGFFTEYGKLLLTLFLLSLVWSFLVFSTVQKIGILSLTDGRDVGALALWLLRYIAWPLLLLTLLFGLVGYCSARKKRWERLQMNFQEMKNELRENDGNPETRAARKQLHQELAMQSIVEGVRKAQVIVVNRER